MTAFTEFGFGNKSAISTEFEIENREHRLPRFIVLNNIISIYIRMWIFSDVFILDSAEGFKHKKKGRRKFKIVVGIQSEK